MHALERRLHARDLALRAVHPFEWGLDHLGLPDDAHHPRAALDRFNAEAIAASDRFFTPPPASRSDFEFDGHNLQFPSGVATPYPENNVARARYFPAGDQTHAVIISPHWNADENSYIALARGLNRFGISALRLSLPYHDGRRPAGLTRAEYMVSANIGRTLQAVRQAVQDIRRAADWLAARGIKRIGVMGTSIGSCVSWLAFAHDRRLQAGAFNMVSSYFGDVVWRGLTTSHIRAGLETELTAEETRRAWLAISPSVYTPRLSGDPRPALMISARYDLTFLPDLSRLLFDDCARHGVGVQKAFLPCGHYTIGRTPFKYIDGWRLINFFRRTWAERTKEVEQLHTSRAD
ncbi:MAG: abhydrolase domain-containing 18 [Acidobacteria bacterium]|nr:abhydrolase domain-containing 18 [Acidobacteriota bacterium]MCW5970629.1 hypothetical protein [Blastocatellales bacterium]